MSHNHILSRRQLVIGGSAITFAMPATGQSLIDVLKSSTRSDQLGPYYPIARPLDQDNDLTRLVGHSGVAKGKIIDIYGKITNNLGHVMSNARLDIWQANAVGKYMHPGDTSDRPLDPNFQGSAVLMTDSEGNYRLRTVLPGIYPVGEHLRPRHIHFDVKTSNARLTTQMYFPGEKENAGEQIAADDNRVAKATTPLEGDIAAYQWNVIVPFG